VTVDEEHFIEGNTWIKVQSLEIPRTAEMRIERLEKALNFPAKGKVEFVSTKENTSVFRIAKQHPSFEKKWFTICVKDNDIIVEQHEDMSEDQQSDFECRRSWIQPLGHSRFAKVRNDGVIFVDYSRGNSKELELACFGIGARIVTVDDVVRKNVTALIVAYEFEPLMDVFTIDTEKCVLLKKSEFTFNFWNPDTDPYWSDFALFGDHLAFLGNLEGQNFIVNLDLKKETVLNDLNPLLDFSGGRVCLAATDKCFKIVHYLKPDRLIVKSYHF